MKHCLLRLLFICSTLGLSGCAPSAISDEAQLVLFVGEILVDEISKVRSSSSTTKNSSGCPVNISACSNADICQRGSRSDKGKRIWDERSAWLEYAVEAKKRGLSCGVMELSSPKSSVCTPNNIKGCSNTTVCQLAVVNYNEEKIWRHTNNSTLGQYVVEAKKRGLSCGVMELSSPKSSVCTPNNIKGCSNTTVCQLAVVNYNEEKIWRHTNNSTLGQYVVEAKKRGLSCGVVSSTSITKAPPPAKSTPKKAAICSSENINICSNDLLCSRGSRSVQGKRIWDERSYWLKYAVEAKKRGLSCGVTPSSSTTKLDRSNEYVCNRAAPTSKSGKTEWLPSSSVFYKYVVEAKNRGLSCGVTTSSPKPTVETKAPKIAPSVPKKKAKAPINTTTPLRDPLHVTNYGKTYHTALLPKVIFFIGEIEDGDERGFRRALRNHDVDTVVLASPGGLIYNGLELANIIFDNKLTTYIPVGETCASACSFMFFAGNSKVAHGRLGVHQFYVEDDKKKVAIGKVQRSTQLTTSVIIQNLTDFGTPPSVFAKMFASSGMYFFSEEEKSAFSNSNKISQEIVTRINEVLSYDEIDDAVLNGMPQDMKSSLIQLELLRIGCMQGPVDGIKGEATESAIQLLSSKLGANLSTLRFSDQFRRLNKTNVGACY